MVKKNILPVFIAVIILLLSLSGAESFGKMNFMGLKHADKAVHSIMYFVLAFVLFYQNRAIINNSKKLLVLAIIPLLFGAIIEFLQSWLTTTRKGDVFDFLFNIIGIVIAIIVWRLFREIYKPYDN
jgi:VanZ family protein